ncbi:hypothetical protein NDU88_007969 [Pleurodeles waltl]|uniref:Uncharacterized protein n=1 Tax=Pleurodeles waltl TaxID=8319 RepID=A0AAV7N6W9_PLEWA|nr:hypothetical protein NDU88_007969 [Pleurodeles waltl]
MGLLTSALCEDRRTPDKGGWVREGARGEHGEGEERAGSTPWVTTSRRKSHCVTLEPARSRERGAQARELCVVLSVVQGRRAMGGGVASRAT